MMFVITQSFATPHVSTYRTIKYQYTYTKTTTFVFYAFCPYTAKIRIDGTATT